MIKRRFILMILILCLAFSMFAPCASAVSAPELNAKAAMVVDLGSDTIIYELNKDEERAPASLTKIMTVLLALEAIDRGDITMSDMVTAQSDCRDGLGEDSSSSGILPGITLSMKDLLYCTLLQSANEAGNIIASYISGSINAFVQAMNDKAAELGCTHTHFVNTNGLPAEGHYSSCYDLYLITRAALNYPLFMEICNCTSYQADCPDVNNGYPLSNSNALISAGSIYGSDYLYEFASGIKTGYTRAAGYCLISTAKKGNMNLFSVVMGCDGQLNSDSDKYHNFIDSSTLYDWSFENFSYRTIVSQAEQVCNVEVALAEDGKTAALRPMSDMSVLMSNDMPNSDIVRKVTVYEDRLVAPISAGTVLGEMQLSSGNVIFGTVRLVNSADIALSKTAYIKQRIGEILDKGWVKAVLIIIAVFLLLYIVLVLRYRRLRQKHLKERRRAEAMRRQEKERLRRQLNGSDRSGRRGAAPEEDDDDDFLVHFDFGAEEDDDGYED